MANFDNIAFKESLCSLSNRKQLGFVLLLCERMMPALSLFASETGFSDSIYKECLHDAWQHLTGNTSPLNYGERANDCLNAAPDTEEFDHQLTSAALNAALSVGATMSFIADCNVERALEIADFARDTVALYAQSIDAIHPHSLSLDEIIKHPLVQQELRRQAADLNFLKALPTDVSGEAIPLLKARAQETPALLPPQISDG